MFRTYIENIKKDQRKLSKLSKKIKLEIATLARSASIEFEKRWSQQFKNNSYFASTGFEAGCLTDSWHAGIVLIAVDDNMIDENQSGKLSFEQVRKFCQDFTTDTGIEVSIQYIPRNKTSSTFYTTTDEDEEELEL